MSAGKGVLFYGPAGTGETLLAQVIANECQPSLIPIKAWRLALYPPREAPLTCAQALELSTMENVEPDANIRGVCDGARAAAPCVVFFVDLDSLSDIDDQFWTRFWLK
jgi:transitional endoplasmic reticulum ATPase